MDVFKKQNFTLLFHGDSITHGGRKKSMDCNHLLGHGFAEMISAEIGLRYMDKTPRFVNRGVAGIRLAGVIENWETEVEEVNPDLLTLLIGVNDAWHAAPICEWEESYRSLLHGVRRRHPEMPVVLIEPFYFPMLPDGSDPYAIVPHPHCEEDFPWPARNNTPAVVERNVERLGVMQETVAKTAKEIGAIYIPMQKRFTELSARIPLSYLIWDGVHPTVVGHRILADAWLSATAFLFK